MSYPTVQIHEVGFHVQRMRTRFPFRYGIAAMTEVPHLFVRVVAEIGGRPAVGITSEGLPPKWFTKNPETKFEEDLPEMLESITHAADLAVEFGQRASFFRWWRRVYEAQMAWAIGGDMPPLLAGLGAALLERAALDAFCRCLDLKAAEAIRNNTIGIDLGAIHAELGGKEPKDFLPKKPLREVIVRHTIGLGDALTKAGTEDRPSDTLPYTLEENIRRYGLTHFKVKVSGDLDQDLDRLQAIQQLLDHEAPKYRFTLDGNEQFTDVNDLQEWWDAVLGHESLDQMMSLNHLLFLEQPIHRDLALKTSLKDWKGPPVIIDESDAQMASAKQAMGLGYSGTSHKNCKGIIKSIANACLVQLREANTGHPSILSGEDLANVGPVAMLQDLAIMQALGVKHVERNGHYYFKGLSMFSSTVQEQVMDFHGDLYRQSKEGFPSLDIREGTILTGSVADAPFGVHFLFEPQDSEWLPGEVLNGMSAFKGI